MKNKIVYLFFVVLSTSCENNPDNNQKNIKATTLAEFVPYVMKDSLSRTVYAPTKWFSGNSGASFVLKPDYSQDTCEQEKFVTLNLDSNTRFTIYLGTKDCIGGHRQDTVIGFEMELKSHYLPYTETSLRSKRAFFNVEGIVNYASINIDVVDSSGGNILIEGYPIRSMVDLHIYKKVNMFHMLTPLSRPLFTLDLSSIEGLQPEDTVGEYLGSTLLKRIGNPLHEKNSSPYLISKEETEVVVMQAYNMKTEVIRLLQARYF